MDNLAHDYGSSPTQSSSPSRATDGRSLVTVVNPRSREGDGGAPDTCAPAGESERAGADDVVDAQFKEV
jgi:hypothetical protein